MYNLLKRRQKINVKLMMCERMLPTKCRFILNVFNKYYFKIIRL